MKKSRQKTGIAVSEQNNSLSGIPVQEENDKPGKQLLQITFNRECLNLRNSRVKELYLIRLSCIFFVIFYT